jgi:transposase InsO family protein
MDERRDFLRLARVEGGPGLAELCRRFGISRQAAYRLLSRAASEGEAAALRPRSRRPKVSPRQSPAETEAAVLALRERHPAWGGRKLARRLRDQGLAAVPAPSTITAILRRHGRLAPLGALPGGPDRHFERAAPNELWQMDFKGHFALDHGRCHALGVLDDHSRFALGLAACRDERDLTVRERLAGVFRRFGLPEAILCDNGAPWGGGGSGAPTALEVWLMRQGVRMLHGRPHHPETQGKEERFHRTLSVELLQMRRFRDLEECQHAFDAWRQVYNHERPHQALGLATPASRYQPSPRRFAEPPPEPEYSAGDAVRRVKPDGSFRFAGRRWVVGQAFARQPVALRPTATDGLWKVFYARFPIIEINQRSAPR